MIYLCFTHINLRKFNDDKKEVLNNGTSYANKFINPVIRESIHESGTCGQTNIFYYSDNGKYSDSTGKKGTYINGVNYYRYDYQFFKGEHQSNVSTIIFELNANDAKTILASDKIQINFDRERTNEASLYQDILNKNQEEIKIIPNHTVLISNAKEMSSFHPGEENTTTFTEINSRTEGPFSSIKDQPYDRQKKYIRFEPSQTEYIDYFKEKSEEDSNRKNQGDTINRIRRICLVHCIVTIYNAQINKFNIKISDAVNNTYSTKNYKQNTKTKDGTGSDSADQLNIIEEQLKLISEIVKFNVKYFSVNPVNRDNVELFLIYEFLTERYPINALHEEQSKQLSFLADILIMKSNRRIEEIRLEDQERKAKEKEIEKEKKQKDIEKTNLEEKHKSNRFNYIGAYVAVMSIMLAVFNPIIERMWEDLLDDKTNLKEVFLGFDLLTNSLLTFIFIVISSSIALQRFIKSEDKNYQSELRLLDE